MNAVTSTARKPKPGSSLAEVHPDVASEWHAGRNGDVTPADVSRGSNRKVWWLCPDCGHEWQTRVASRTTHGSGCPPCSHRKKLRLDGGNALAEAHPDIVSQWHPDLNGDLTPADVSRSSGKEAWWLCSDCGHEWQAQIARRTSKGSGCPPCSMNKRFRLDDGNSLAEAHPDIAAEWHPDRNGDLTPADVTRFSNKKAWWLCSGCGHTWQTQIAQRTGRGTGCKPCSIKKVSPRRLDRGNSLAEAHPDIASEWHPVLNGDLTPAGVSRGTTRKAWWLCGDCGNEWEATINSRTASKRGCPPCSRKRGGRSRSETRRNRNGNTLAEVHPDIAAEWHPVLNGKVSPDKVTPSSGVHAWWVCSDCDHVWKTMVASRTSNGTGCPPCATKKTAAEKRRAATQDGNSLAETHPDIASQWHPHRNGDITPTGVSRCSGWKAWWLCSGCGHEWQTSVANRTTNGYGCQPCSRKKIDRRRLDDGNTLAENHPEVAAEWHSERNGDLTPNGVSRASSQKVWWLCSGCGHEWETSVASRTTNGSGCRPCSRKKMDRRRLDDGNTLAETHPEIAAQWHPDRNGSFTPNGVSLGSSKKVWWLCSNCGHEWQTRVSNRTSGTGCKSCASSKRKRQRQPVEP